MALYKKRRIPMNSYVVELKKTEYDYWLKKGTIDCAVKLVGNVSVLITESQFMKYYHRLASAPCLIEPRSLLEVALYENLYEVFHHFYDSFVEGGKDVKTNTR